METSTRTGTRAPAAGTRRRRTGQGELLSAERIVEVAAHLLEVRGASELSARKLGAALGAHPTAIYRYFTGMDELLLALADRVLGQALAGYTPSEDWRDSLRDLAHRLHTAYTAHPNLAQLGTSRVTRRANEMRFVETVLAALRQAGFSPAQAVVRYGSFADCVLSFAAQDAASDSLDPKVQRADDQSWRTAYYELPRETHPYIHECRDELALQMSRSSFEDALEFVIGGFEALRTKATQRTGDAVAHTGGRR